jgi:ATP-binding cassette subfamily B protein
VRLWNLDTLRSNILYGSLKPDDAAAGAASKDDAVDAAATDAGVNDAADAASDAAVNDAVSQAASIAGLDADMAAFADGTSTIIGERGLTLSGGQKQRTAIARAVHVDPEVLILDDSLSAVDAQTERRILDNLYRSRRGKTTIIVSHRVSALSRCDYAAVLENGRLAEYGPPAALAAGSGAFARMAALQRLG